MAPAAAGRSPQPQPVDAAANSATSVAERLSTEMEVDFRRALSYLVPVFMPDILFRLDAEGQPLFKEFATAIVPRPGRGSRSRTQALWPRRATARAAASPTTPAPMTTVSICSMG